MAENLCPNCGAPVPEGATACLDCDTPLDAPTEQSATTSLRSTARNTAKAMSILSQSFLETVQSAAENEPPAEPPAEVHNTKILQLVALFFGVFGLHDFMLGNTTKGTIKLAMTALSGGILSPISGLWALIDVLDMDNHAYKCGPEHALEGEGCVKHLCLLLLVLASIITAVVILASY